MLDTLPQFPFNVESGIVNLNTSSQPGSHLGMLLPEQERNNLF